MTKDTINLQLTNTPKQSEPGKRVIGFTIDESELECMGLFSPLLEKYAVLFLQTRGYEVKKGINKRLTVETTV